ncbi:MAG: serine protease [Oscillospiraceae bacterium]|nr:serine protease [Oscillospiraceae bacterium]
MKKASCVALIIILLLPFAVRDAAALGFSDDPAAIAEAAKSVLLLYVFDEQGEIVSSGSGFVALDGLEVITNYHVVSEANMIFGIGDDRRIYVFDRILAADKELDIAILRMPKSGGMKPLPLAQGDIVLRAERVVAIGTPQGDIDMLNTVSLGNVSNVSASGHIQFTAPISSGNSGGALINDVGKVIGITTESLVGNAESIVQNVNFAIPAELVIDMYQNKRHDVYRYLFINEELLAVHSTPMSDYLDIEPIAPRPTIAPAATSTPRPTIKPTMKPTTPTPPKPTVKTGENEDILLFFDKNPTDFINNYAYIAMDEVPAYLELGPNEQSALTLSKGTAVWCYGLYYTAQGERMIRVTRVGKSYVGEYFVREDALTLRIIDLITPRPTLKPIIKPYMRPTPKPSPRPTATPLVGLVIPYADSAKYWIQEDTLHFWIKVENISKVKTVKAFEMEIYTTDVWGKRLHKGNYSSVWTTIKNIKPGEQAFSDYAAVMYQKETYGVYASIIRVIYTDGTIVSPPRDYRGWELDV